VVIHLHPIAQSKLLDVLLEEGKIRNIKLLITTHSEKIVYYALTKVGLNEIPFNDLSLYHFKNIEGGCISNPISFDEKGRLSEGLPDFFETNLDQYKRYIDILIGKEEE